MAGFFDALTGRQDNKFNRPAVELSGAGGNLNNMVDMQRPEKPLDRNYRAAELKGSSSSTEYARERAAAAKAQIEYRKAMEESRKAKESSAKSEAPEKKAAAGLMP